MVFEADAAIPGLFAAPNYCLCIDLPRVLLGSGQG